MVNDDSGENEDDTDNTRGRGILTPADREFLSASVEEREENYSAPARSQRRRAIADRVENALLDFIMLTREVSISSVQDIFAPKRVSRSVDDEKIGSNRKRAHIGIPFGVAFLLRARLAADMVQTNPRSGVEEAVAPFLSDIGRGIEIWMNEQYGLTGEVDVSLSADNLQHADELADEVRNINQPLTGRERIETVSRLGRAGYGPDEILNIVGDPNDDS